MAAFGRRKPGASRANDAPEWVQKHQAANGAGTLAIDDMVMLVKADVKGIVANLEARLAQGTIYTYIGHVLTVMNPYKWLDIYGDDSVK